MYYLWMVLMIICSNTWAKTMVDLHGLHGEIVPRLLKKYTPDIQQVETQIMNEFFKLNVGNFDVQHYGDLVAQKQRLIATIKQEGPFAFVDLQTVYYQDNLIATTLEIIDDTESNRMRFVSPLAHPQWTALRVRLQNIYRKLMQRPDLINKMQEYENLVTQLTITHQLDDNGNDCPAYHCLTAFKHRDLIPYWDIFQQGVVKEKKIILSTLRNDLDPERRAAAAFLVGHFSDPKEILTTLSPSIEDVAPQVRNNALRVIALTLFKSHLNETDCMPFIKLLDSPFVSDRNKALTVLLALADNSTNQKKIIQYASQSIMDLLRLTQPDNHESAHLLLKKISKQDFGEYQFLKWQDWVNQAQES